jgi:hypothetical protein
MPSWAVAEAKARFSEVVEQALSEGPQEITRNGKRDGSEFPHRECVGLLRSGIEFEGRSHLYVLHSGRRVFLPHECQDAAVGRLYLPTTGDAPYSSRMNWTAFSRETSGAGVRIACMWSGIKTKA